MDSNKHTTAVERNSRNHLIYKKVVFLLTRDYPIIIYIPLPPTY